ncbi:MAG: hypothetical protein Q8N26_18385 [Myxococcales bacterium]|nr:hypothetical protein [Myxococcales bacterium]
MRFDIASPVRGVRPPVVAAGAQPGVVGVVGATGVAGVGVVVLVVAVVDVVCGVVTRLFEIGPGISGEPLDSEWKAERFTRKPPQLRKRDSRSARRVIGALTDVRDLGTTP